MNDAIRMQLSAYVDGELPENEAELLLRRISQDVDLRAEVAEYLALGRLLRDEPGIAGADRLHERVLMALDDTAVAAEHDESKTVAARTIKPLAGLAIAATVALVAIFGLQQTSVDEPAADATATADNTVQPTVPAVDTQQEMQRQFLLNHSDTTSALGANGINSRLVTLEFSDVLETEIETDDDDDEDVDDEVTTQP